MTASQGVIIALDVGERRIGVATANLVTRLPKPWGVIENTTNATRRIGELIEQEGALAIVVGLPRGLEGQDTAQTGKIRAFVEALKPRIGVTIYLQDEALTSKQAEEELHQRGIRYNKGAIDALAATYILNDFLQEHPEFYQA